MDRTNRVPQVFGEFDVLWGNSVERLEASAHSERRLAYSRAGENEEVLELAECPVCGSTLQFNLAEPYDRAHLDESLDVVKLMAEWLSRRASSPPHASCERLRVATRERDLGDKF